MDRVLDDIGAGASMPAHVRLADRVGNHPSPARMLAVCDRRRNHVCPIMDAAIGWNE